MLPFTKFLTNFGRGSWLRIVFPKLVAAAVCLSAWTMANGQESKVQPAPADSVVATINSQTVSADEYRLVMERKVAGVYSFFKQQHDVDDHPGYWNESSGPDGPLAKLREMVREELVRIKACQGLAKEKGLVQETSFASFQAGFERENARRSAAKSAGQVIYGPVKYRMASYYYILFGDLVYKLKQSLAKAHEPEITEGEIGKFYEENKAAYGGKPLEDMKKGIVTFLSTKAAEKELEALCASAKVEINEPRLRALVPRFD